MKQESYRDATKVVTEQVISSTQLFETTRVVRIEHRGELYQLRLTQSGKLILTK